MKLHNPTIFSMTVSITAAFFFTSLLSPLHAGSTGKPASLPFDSVSLVRLLDSLIVPGLEKYHIPGMAIAIVHGSDIILVKGYGYADVERKIPFSPESTVIRIASVSKLITGTAVLQLVDRGKLNMHQDINSYLTRFKVDNLPGKPITLQHLLTHTAGFDDRYVGKSAWTQETQIPLGDFLATKLPKIICPPGEVYSYSNFSNALAGFVVEEAAHEDYASYVRRNIFEPLEMKRSDYRLRPDLQPLLAQCYSHAGTEFRNNPFDFINDYPGGQMLSTATDMANFMIAHLQLGQYKGARILSEESATAMHSVQFTHHKELEHPTGYSFGIVPARSQTVLMHDGGYTGVGSRLCLSPDNRFGFFVACNIMDGSLLDVVSRTLLDMIIPPPPQDTTKYPLTTLPLFDKDVAQFAGTYRFTRYVHNDFMKTGVLVGMAGSEMNIGQNDEGMILMNTYSGKPRRMIQIEPCLFKSIDDNYQCAFRRDQSGKVTHLFTNGTAAFEKLHWYETTMFHRSLLGACMLFFIFIALILPIVQIIRKTKKTSGLNVDPIQWFSKKIAATFLLYFLTIGIVMNLVVPQEEMAVGFAHGIHWTLYVVQTIALLGVLFVTGLLGLLFWKFVGKSETATGEQTSSTWLGVMTCVAGAGFVFFLWHWNLIGYKF